MTISFFEQMKLPTATAQQRRWTRTGKTYQGDKVRTAKALFRAVAAKHRPAKPMQGPVDLAVVFHYPHTAKSGRKAQSSQSARVPKVSRPDLDNSLKLLLDALTAEGYWLDDAQVVRLSAEKYHCDIEGIEISVNERTGSGRKARRNIP